MRRRIRLLGVLLAAGVPLVASGGVSSASTVPLLGWKGYAPDGNGFGHAHPSAFFNGGDPSGSVSHVHWSSWGGAIALGTGENAIFKPHGGYYATLAEAQLRASELGSCHGHRAYRRLQIRVPRHPRGPLGPWQNWAGGHGSIC